MNCIYFANIDDYINEPYSYIPVVKFEGWLVNENGFFGRVLSHYDTRSANAQDVVKIVNITLREPIPQDNH